MDHPQIIHKPKCKKKCLRIEEMTENDREIFQDFRSIKCQREGYFGLLGMNDFIYKFNSTIRN